MSDEPVLCYVRGETAFFTTCPLHQQWGDDWNDAPYEHNAERPYEWRESSPLAPYRITAVKFEGDFADPAEQSFQQTRSFNSPWSVQDINAGAAPWLRYPCYGETRATFPAGMTRSAFIKGILECGGEVFVPLNGETE